MRNIKAYIIPLAFLLAGCSEEKLPLYSGDQYLFFTYQTQDMPSVVTLNFATDAPLDAQTEVKIPVTLWGNLFSEDRTYNVEVLSDGTTGVAGVDYVGITQGIFGKNLPSDYLVLKVNRNAELLNTNFAVRIALKPGDGYVVGPLKYNTVTAFVKDEVSKPSWWGSTGVSMRLGDYYPVKYRLLSIYLDGDPLATINQYTSIEFGNIITGFKAWWQQQWAEGKYLYYADDNVTPLYETIAD